MMSGYVYVTMWERRVAAWGMIFFFFFAEKGIDKKKKKKKKRAHTQTQ
jgi:hypothetical protein